MDERTPPIPDADAAPDNAAAAPTAEAPSVEEQIKKLEEEKEALFAQLVRRQADFENYRKRAERDQREIRQHAESDLVSSLLPVLDGFERALATANASAADDEYRKGIELIYKQLSDILTRAGLQPIDAVGRTFDPFLHHAVERVETTDYPEDEVLAELQRGYTFKQRLLRPALVRVAVRPRAPENIEPED